MGQIGLGGATQSQLLLAFAVLVDTLKEQSIRQQPLTSEDE